MMKRRKLSRSTRNTLSLLLSYFTIYPRIFVRCNQLIPLSLWMFFSLTYDSFSILLHLFFSVFDGFLYLLFPVINPTCGCSVSNINCKDVRSLQFQYRHFQYLFTQKQSAGDKVQIVIQSTRSFLRHWYGFYVPVALRIFVYCAVRTEFAHLRSCPNRLLNPLLLIYIGFIHHFQC